MSNITHLECPECSKSYSADTPASHCVCGSPLLVIYNLGYAADAFNCGEFPTDINNMWRYSQLLPVRSPTFVVSLGEGWTPMTIARRLGKHLGLRLLRIKNETLNPTGSFKDRGLCTAISKHLELGAKEFALPSAGNAAISTSAYCAAAGVPASIFMPEDTPEPFFRDCEMYGASTHRVKGTISDAGKKMSDMNRDWVNLSTTKEPYRVEGKKTMGFEIVEQLGWHVPDAIVCPTGGGTALIGIWKALDELEGIGVIGSERPRLYAAQSGDCAPIVRAIELGRDSLEPWHDPHTEALGLRVPSPFAGRLILSSIRRSGGSAVAVSETEIRPTQIMAARMEGIMMGPEAAVGLGGLRNLVEAGEIDFDEEVVLLNTGTNLRYV
ncbi:threonine synthase [Candidatus Thorarchaeota archaeon]|nr:MAG: threonine synthase [Candidatus Thorarchaeota archaeon]